MIYLNVNIDHVATLREARRISEPDPVAAASIAQLSGADGITIHLREDRRHINERDVRIIREVVSTKLNLEMAPTNEMFRIALETKPDIVTIVPEKREEITTEGGLDVIKAPKSMSKGIGELQKVGIRVSLFIDPELKQIEASKNLGIEDVELHTGCYANSKNFDEKNKEYERLVVASEFANKSKIQVNAGHGLNYSNTSYICSLPHLCELNIGHRIISRSVFVGLGQAGKEMREIIILNS